jgi:hypothetical protein
LVNASSRERAVRGKRIETANEKQVLRRGCDHHLLNISASMVCSPVQEKVHNLKELWLNWGDKLCCYEVKIPNIFWYFLLSYYWCLSSE